MPCFRGPIGCGRRARAAALRLQSNFPSRDLRGALTFPDALREIGDLFLGRSIWPAVAAFATIPQCRLAALATAATANGTGPRRPERFRFMNRCSAKKWRIWQASTFSRSRTKKRQFAPRAVTLPLPLSLILLSFFGRLTSDRLRIRCNSSPRGERRCH